MRPIAYITGLSAGANDRLLSIEVVDNEGIKSDTCSLEFDDRDAQLAIPPKGKEITVSMGYKETGLVLMGKYTVDEVSVEGWPRKMTVQGKAADLRDKLKQQHNEHHEDKTLKDIVGKIAGRHGLSPVVSQSLAQFKYTSIALTEESDLNFLTRLARRHDAVFAIKNGKLLFLERGEGLSATGADLSQVVVRGPGAVATGFGTVIGSVKSYQCTLPDRHRFGKTKAHWWDRKKAERVYEEGQSAEGPEFATRHGHPTKEEAKGEADGKGKELDRQKGSLQLTIIGSPLIAAELPLVAVGIRAGVDGPWRIKTARHRLDSSGYETQLECDKGGKSGKGEGGGGAQSQAQSAAQASYPPGGA